MQRLCRIFSAAAALAALSLQSIAVEAFQTQHRWVVDSHCSASDCWSSLLVTRRTPASRQQEHPLWSSRLESPDSPFSSSTSSFRLARNRQQRDVVIVGGALAGLATALYLSQMDPNRHITILDRETYGRRGPDESVKNSSGHAQPASFAAAGMLAPQSERLPPGHLLDLCLASRRLFPDFCDLVETLARESGDEGAPYLHDNEFGDRNNNNNNDANSSLDPWSVGYVGTGGFLAPAFAGDSVATWAPPEGIGSPAVWLDGTQARELEPLLHPDVVGGWWFPEDASVDARRLTCSLRAACVAAGVQLLSGPQYEVASLDLVDGTCRGMWLKNSKSKQGQRYIRAKTVLIANGAWMRSLLPVPIEPHKGQSLSLRMPKDRPPILRRVLFAQDSYIVPKADGRIVIGATVEAGSYDPNVTPAGLMHVLTHAIQLVPALRDLPVEETWVGLRPTTPDKGPILGETPWDNLFVAGGYWRNGVLLSPKTGQLLASLITSKSSSANADNSNTLTTDDKVFLDVFAWDRFTNSEKGTALAANARYAAAMHPIHTRSSAGVSAAVGTELGSYSSARAAVEDRKRDRDSLSSDDEASFERAAALGRKDGSAYSFGPDKQRSGKNDWPTLLQKSSDETTVVADFAPSIDISETDTISNNAVAVGSDLSPNSVAEEDKNPVSSNDLGAAYEAIRRNKKRHGAKLEASDDTAHHDDRPDPGFRIYHVDEETGEERMVPPYTQPGVFLEMVKEEKRKKSVSPSATTMEDSLPAPEEITFVEATTSQAPNHDGSNAAGDDDYNETMYDGYTVIQNSNARASREEELEAMREARRRNRIGQELIDESQIGAVRPQQQPMNGDTTASF